MLVSVSSRMKGLRLIQTRANHTATSMLVNSLSTRPIAMPQPDPNLPRFKRLLALGKGFVNLYKSGIKNVWKNQKEVRQMRREWHFTSVNQLSQYVVDTGFVQDSPEPTSLKPSSQHITRAQYQLLLRTERDILKLPFFAVIFAVFFETTPLLVLLFPRITPVPCYTPSALEKHNKVQEKSITVLHDLGKHLPDEPNQLARSVYKLSNVELAALGRFSNKLWLPTSFYTIGHLQKVVNHYLMELRCDNLLLQRFGGPSELDDYELASACLERAITVSGKTAQQQRDQLARWIDVFTKNRYDAGFLLRKNGIVDKPTGSVENLGDKI